MLHDDSVEVASEIDQLRRDHIVVAAAMLRASEVLATPPSDDDHLREIVAVGRPPRRPPPPPGRRSSSTTSTASTPPPATRLRDRSRPPGVSRVRPTVDQTVGVRVFRCFAFVDMCGFTRMNDTLGDDEAVAVLRRSGRSSAGSHPTTGSGWASGCGDGCMFVATEIAPDRRDACSTSSQRMESADIVLPLRIGIASGDVILFEGDDFIGMSINLASRLCDAAAPGEILVHRRGRRAAGRRATTRCRSASARSRASSRRSRSGASRSPSARTSCRSFVE